MITRRGSIIRAMVVFGSMGVAGLIWAYTVLNAQGSGGSVEVKQLAEPAWDVQISEIGPGAGVIPSARPGMVAAEGSHALD